VRETIVDLVVFEYVFGGVLVVVTLVFLGVFGVFTALKERREQNRRMKEIMDGDG
jgi:hypothetical protein